MGGENRFVLTLATVAAAWVCGAAAIGVDPSFLGFFPVFLVVVLLLRGRYLGEGALGRLRRSRHAPRRRALAVRTPLPRRLPVVAAVHGGERGRHVAVGPPPAVLLL